MMFDRPDPDATASNPDEFWGEQTEWGSQLRPSGERRARAGTMGRWWGGLLGGRSGAGPAGGDGQRSHGHGGGVDSPTHDSLPKAGRHEHRTIGNDGDAGDELWTFEPEPQPIRRPGADPLLTRLGGVAVIIALAAPLLVGFASSRSDSSSVDSLATMAPAETIVPAATAATTPAGGLAETVEGSTANPASPDVIASTVAPTNPLVVAEAIIEASSTDSASLETQPATAATTTPTSVTATPATAVPACAQRYDVAAGDYWIRLADSAGISLAALLLANDASVDTVLVPGRSICLPAGASMPSPPPVGTAPATTPAPATTAPSRSPAKSTPPPDTVAPTTTVASRPAAIPATQAADIIRAVWPDELEERALEIAWRESNYRSNVNNFCCYGLFQIYFSVHRGWLSTMGVNAAQDLFDPQLNAEAAYQLYLRAGGWGPWGG
jgi:LysM repeat protein